MWLSSLDCLKFQQSSRYYAQHGFPAYPTVLFVLKSRTPRLENVPRYRTSEHVSRYSDPGVLTRWYSLSLNVSRSKSSKRYIAMSVSDLGKEWLCRCCAFICTPVLAFMAKRNSCGMPKGQGNRGNG